MPKRRKHPDFDHGIYNGPSLDEHFSHSSAGKVLEIIKDAYREGKSSSGKLDDTCFEDYSKKYKLKERLYSGEKVLVSVDRCFFQRVPARFFQQNSGEWYEMCFTRHVVREINGYFRSEEGLKRIREDEYAKKVFYNISSIDVKITDDEKDLIQNAAREGYQAMPRTRLREAQKRLGRGDLSMADMDQIGLILQRAKKGKSTLALTDDLGIFYTLGALCRLIPGIEKKIELMTTLKSSVVC